LITFDPASNRKDILVVSQHKQTHLRTIANQDGAAILDTEAGRITTLNSTGAFVWQSLERAKEIEAIAEALARQTGEPIEAVREDVVDFVEALKKQNLLPG
jgi:hypothetical protein